MTWHLQMNGPYGLLNTDRDFIVHLHALPAKMMTRSSHDAWFSVLHVKSTVYARENIVTWPKRSNTLFNAARLDTPLRSVLSHQQCSASARSSSKYKDHACLTAPDLTSRSINACNRSSTFRAAATPPVPLAGESRLVRLSAPGLAVFLIRPEARG